MGLARTMRHLFTPNWLALKAFPKSSLQKIGEAIRRSEQTHDGEIRFVIEASLPPAYLRKKRSSRSRADELFSQLRVWDTEHNTGVLIYVQLVSRHIDIVADRGIARKVGQNEWDEICRAMRIAFAEKQFEKGAIDAIERVTALLARHFPGRGGNPNELPDQPVVLK